MSERSVKVPDIGEGIAEVELVAWSVQTGDAVAEDQPLADVMTEKATVEIPSPVAGTVIALGGEPGRMLQVGAELIRIAMAEDSPGVIPASAAAPAVTVPINAAAPAVAVPPAPTLKPLASPSVRQYARERDVDLAAIRGSGPDGRVLREDVDAHLAANRSAPECSAHDIPMIGLRRQIARKMQQAMQSIPHFTYVEEIDMTECEALRQHLNEKHGTTRGRLSLLPFVARAMVLAIRDFPQVNTRFDDAADRMTRYGAIHLGVATHTPGGLMVPVVRNAESLDLWASAREIARLAEAARAGRATREELSGSTITLSSLGALGGIVATPIINSPEVAIVGVNRMVERPMLRSGLVVARQMMNLSSSFDHRVIDGMDAAQFVQAMRGYLEAPATLFVN